MVYTLLEQFSFHLLQTDLLPGKLMAAGDRRSVVNRRLTLNFENIVPQQVTQSVNQPSRSKDDIF
jgi:hypothetical protein